jgi:hypothetical protein
LADDDAVLVIDETGFLKQGKASCGTRQPTPHDIQLMSKHRVLSFKPQLRLEWRGQDGQNETEQPDHSASLGDSITASTQIRFSVHTVPKSSAGCFGLLSFPSLSLSALMSVQ